MYYNSNFKKNLTSMRFLSAYHVLRKTRQTCMKKKECYTSPRPRDDEGFLCSGQESLGRTMCIRKGRSCSKVNVKTSGSAGGAPSRM